MAKKAKAAEKKTGDADLNSGAFQAEAKPILGVDLKGELKDIPLHQVVDPDGTPDRMQRPGDEAAIAQLARSMRECGQLQPVMVEVLNPGKAEAYRRVFGRRRIAAARSLGWTTIRASVVGELPADVRRTVVAIENVQRQDLTPAEETLAVDELMRLQALAATRQFNSRLGPECGAYAGTLVTDGLLADITGASDQWQRAAQHDLLLDHRVRGIAAELVAAMLGKPASWVRDRLYIGRLGEAAKKLVLEGKLPLAHAREIAKLADGKLRDELAKDFAAGGSRSISDVEAGKLEDLQDDVRRSVFSLADVPWKLSLPFAAKPACEGCPNNSATNPGLFEHGGEVSTEMKAGRGTYDSREADHFRVQKTGICTLPACYQVKLLSTKGAISAAAKRIVDGGKKPAEAKVPSFVDDAALTAKVNARRKLVGSGKNRTSSGAGEAARQANSEAKRKATWAREEAEREVLRTLVKGVQKCLDGHPLRAAVLCLADEYGSSAPQKGPELAEFLRTVAAASPDQCRSLILKDIEGRKLKWEPGVYGLQWPEAEAIAKAFEVELGKKPALEDFMPKPEAKPAKKKTGKKKDGKKPAAVVAGDEVDE